MRRIISAILDCIVIYFISCIFKVIFNSFMLYLNNNVFLDETPLYVRPLEILIEDNAGITTILFNYGFFHLDFFAIYFSIAFILYMIISEFIFNGKTIGKKVMRLQIIYSNSNNSLVWKIVRIFLKLICVIFWYISILIYMQLLRMPYDKHLGITVESTQMNLV